MNESQLIEKTAEIATEVLKERSKDIYDDGLKPATKEGGEALQAIIGLFNNVVLYPVKKANINFKYKLEQFEHDLKSKTEKIPKEKLIEPSLTIAGPTLEALKYTFDTKELREMYIELLSSAMNIDTANQAHPSYVEIIKAMSPLEAQIIKEFKQEEQIPSAVIKFKLEDDRFYTEAMPSIFAPKLLKYNDAFLVASSIENLCRLGLIKHKEQTWVTPYDYDVFKEHPFVLQRYNLYKTLNREGNLTIDIGKSLLEKTQFGKNFIKTCTP